MIWSLTKVNLLVKRIFRYLIKVYLGQYLESYTQDKLSYGFSYGSGSVEDVRFNIEALNSKSEEYKLPVEFVDCSIDSLSFQVPLINFANKNSIIEIKGLKLVLQPKERPDDDPMFSSMFDSMMTSSYQLAEEYLNSKTDEEEEDEEFDDYNLPAEGTGGVSSVANLINAFFANLKVKFIESYLEVRHIPEPDSPGVAFQIKIESADYFDEAGHDSSSPNGKPDSEKFDFELQDYSIKRLILEGMSMFTSQCSADSKTTKASSTDYMDPSQFVPGSPEMPPTHSSFPTKKTEAKLELDPILISKFLGKQEVRLKLKQKQTISGPKVDVEFSLGSLNLYLIPQQVHILFEIFTELMKPGSNGDIKRKLPLSVANKPMKAADYALVEQELLRQQQRCDGPSKSLKNQQGWSSHSLDESDDEFQLMTMHNKRFVDVPNSSLLNEADSLCSSISSDTRSDCTGSVSSNRQSKTRGSTVQAMLQDQMSELTYFQGSFSSLCVIILHDDSVNESFNRSSDNISKSASKRSYSLKERAETFFNNLHTLQMNGLDFTDFSTTRESLSELCPINHLRLMASSISVTGSKRSSSAQCTSDFSLTVAKFEVLECLFNSANIGKKLESSVYVPLLVCDQKISVDESNSGVSEACFSLKYQQVEYTTQSRLLKPPANKLDIQFGPLSCEIDISLADRIQTLLNFQSSSKEFGAKHNWKDSESTRFSSITEVSFFSPDLTINLRFPIPDLRSVHDMDRVPWWQQNLHPEVLIIETKDITFITAIDGDAAQSKYEFQCRDLHALFKSAESEDAVSFLRVSVDPDVDEISQRKGFGLPRLVIHKTSKVPGADLDPGVEEHEEIFSYSITDVIMSNLDTKPTPFSSASVIYGSKLKSRRKSEREEINDSSIDLEQVIKPADKETILQFMEQTITHSEYLYEFSLPAVNLVMPNKEFFELIYNRLGNDLLLWQKTILTPKAPYDPNGFKVHIPGLDSAAMNDLGSQSHHIFRPFSNDSNSDSEEDVNYYSFSELNLRQKPKYKKNDNNNALTKISITINIAKGNLTVYTPILDNSNEVGPGVCGKLLLSAEEGHLFIASSYKGDDNEAYFCVLAEKSTLFHKGFLNAEKLPVVQPLSRNQPQNIQRIIYKTDPTMHLKTSICDTFKNGDMLKIAVQINHTPKQQLKSFKVAIDISDATLRHYMQASNQMWINQIIDFLKVRDLPVNGYVPSAVVTEFHLNLSNCAIDYRPLKLPLQSVITMENFNMSCNIATSSTFLFRLISDEMRLFLSNEITAKIPNLKKNYVCVIDSGLIDVSIRTSVTDKKERRLDACVTNNIITIKTCSDSFRALVDIFAYVSASGDMDSSQSEDKKEEKEIKSSVMKDADVENLNLLMAEAMKDVPKDFCSERCSESMDKKTDDQQLVNIDDEFCILEDDPGVGVLPRNGEPQVRILTKEPIQIIENHFSVPPGKSDVFKAPKHFPDPLITFTLREMSLVFHHYGGSDFKRKQKNSKNKKKEAGVSFSDSKSVAIDSNQSTVSFCKISSIPLSGANVTYSAKQIPIDHIEEHDLETWLNMGGANRNHDVLMELHMKKMKFVRDIYPEDNEYASRYVFLVDDIEIRDRLKSSKINKFLYQYSSQKRPRQSNAHMVEVKALYTRPDTSCPSEECSLHVSCKPLRLNIDQDSLIFLMKFYKEALGQPSEESTEDTKEKTTSVPPNQVVNVPLTQYNSNLNTETFYRVFSFSPDVLIRIDYQGKRVAMDCGPLANLFLGLGQLNSSEIRLKHLCYRHGLLGHHKVFQYALTAWQHDIINNQLPGLLEGVGPIHCFVQIFTGVKDFFYCPVVQYKKDGQIIRGLQRGASSLSTSTFVALLELTNGVVRTIHDIASFGYDMVSPGPSKFQKSKETFHQITQPADVREGLTTAVNVFKRGMTAMSRDMYTAASAEHEHKGVPGAIGGVLRQIPQAVIKPVIVGAEATNLMLDGVRHQLMPDAHQEDIHKWRTKNC